MKTLGKTRFAEERKPFEINLQLFADDSTSEPGEGEPVDTGLGVSPDSLDDVDNSVNDSNIDDDNNSDDGNDDINNQDDSNDDNYQQSPEINAAFARMRRQIEKADRIISQIYGKEFGVHSVDELEELYNKMEQQHMQQQYQKTGQLDPNYIMSLINNHPAIKAATQIAEDQKLLNNFNALKKEYPELVKTADDIPEEVWDQYDKGISLVDAFTIVKRKEILDFYKNAGKQKALNSINSKKHLKTEGDGASQDDGGVSIPPETLSMYIEMGMTKEEAVAHYRKLYK